LQKRPLISRHGSSTLVHRYKCRTCHRSFQIVYTCNDVHRKNEALAPSLRSGPLLCHLVVVSPAFRHHSRVDLGRYTDRLGQRATSRARWFFAPNMVQESGLGSGTLKLNIAFDMASKVGCSGAQLRTVAAVKSIEIDHPNPGIKRIAAWHLMSQFSGTSACCLTA
jgi:hypothetical protein